MLSVKVVHLTSGEQLDKLCFAFSARKHSEHLVGLRPQSTAQ